ncbi:(pine wood nematode) hypothetical protein [Aphelenchoides fujianensis]|nr:(pine wood nematode) hypothetical protein [Aphelenchoides fujianensis]
MCVRTFTIVAALTVLIGLTNAAEQQAEHNPIEGETADKRSGGDFYMPRASSWLSSRPVKAFSANDDISYLLQYLQKRSDSGEGVRDIRSPLGTMRFGKRGDGPLGTMRFGKRADNPLGTMRFGKRSGAPMYNPDLF